MRASRGEIKIQEILKASGLSFAEEYSFPDLVSNGGISGLRKQQYNDMRKRQYCKKHNINLVIIPYWDEGRITYDYIITAAGW